MKHEGYAIIDEPLPGRLEKWAMNPAFTLLGLMLGGTYVGFAWFALNTLALGSSRRGRELTYAALGALGTSGWYYLLLTLGGAHVISLSALPYVAQAVLVWKLAFGYALYSSQQVSHELFQLYGGKTRSGAVWLLGAFVVNVWVKANHGGELWALLLF